MTRHATLLYVHLRELEKLNGTFERAAPVMERLSKKERKLVPEMRGLMGVAIMRLNGWEEWMWCARWSGDGEIEI
jgi:hypothetical protein